MSNTADGSRNLTTHEQFNESVGGTDAIIHSSDGVIFYLHRKYLQVNATIPGFDRDIDGPYPEKVVFDEPSNVLEILFRFIYPRKQPSLEDTDFETLMAVAEAVEKYQVFSAMNLCELRLEKFLPCDKHAIRILVHAFKYNYTKLVDEAALRLCRKPDLEVVLQSPPALIIPWLKYRRAWKEMFDLQLQMAINDPLDGEYYSLTEVCLSCTAASTLAWLQFLENLDRLSDLKSSLIALGDERKLSSQYQLVTYLFGSQNFAHFSARIKGTQCSHRSQPSRRSYLPDISRQLLKAIEDIPPFMDFLKSD